MRYYHVYLQLYEYDCNLNKEDAIEGYRIMHPDGTNSPDENFNILFSKEFGLKIEPKYESEKDFLSN